MQNTPHDEICMLQAQSTRQGQFTGPILASSLPLGTCKAFRLKVTPAGQAMAAVLWNLHHFGRSKYFTHNTPHDEVGMLQGRSTQQGLFTGLILASSLALGTCMAFRFKVAPSGQLIAAHPPEDAAKKRMQRGLRTNWGLIEVQTAASSPSGMLCDVCARGFPSYAGILSYMCAHGLSMSVL